MTPSHLDFAVDMAALLDEIAASVGLSDLLRHARELAASSGTDYR